VRPSLASIHAVGQVIVDPGVVVHALSNPAETGQLLVTAHVYSPPLPEVRRYTVAARPPSPVFLRRASPAARVIAIIGGGFTGTMTLANLLRHARPFWEVHRHRMAPDIAAQIAQLRARGILDLAAGALLSAEADAEGINVKLSSRRSTETRELRVSWVLNCTGPGTHGRQGTHPILRPLIEAGVLLDDPLGLGLRTDADGRALRAGGEAHANLLIAGTLRKSTLWESTAVPELRQQAATAAQIALQNGDPI
jgi:uncharacterized NAD(P)/FAD-binding protein YdhS